MTVRQMIEQLQCLPLDTIVESTDGEGLADDNNDGFAQMMVYSEGHVLVVWDKVNHSEDETEHQDYCDILRQEVAG